MAGKSYYLRPVVLAAGAAAVGLVSIASAQDRDGGKTLRVTVGETLQYSDNINLVANPADGIFRSSTRVGLSYSDVTRTQELRFTTGGAYEIDSDGENEFSDPFARLSYSRDGANSKLSFSASYLRTNLDDAFATIPLLDVNDDNVTETARIESGVRINTDYRFRFETGLRSNIGLQLDLSGQDRRYTDTINPDLFETKTRRIGVVSTFRFDPSITGRLTANARRYTAEDDLETNRTEVTYGAGVAIDVTPITSIDLSFGHQRTETERRTGTSLSEGQTYGVNLTRDLPNGAIETSFASGPTVNGRRNTLRLNRNMTLRRDGTLSYGIGVTKTKGFSSEPLFNIAYAQPLRLGRFGINLSQEARTDDEDDDAVILTRLSANYAMPLSETLNLSISGGLNDVAARNDDGDDRRRIDLRGNLTGQLNEISSWSLGATMSDTRTSSLTASDRQRRYGIQLSYRRDLAQDWDVVARYQHTKVTDAGAADRTSNAISLGIEKTFDFRP